MTDRTGTRNAPRWVTAALALLGIVLIVIAVVYFAELADKLPSFFPGNAAGISRNHTTPNTA